MFLANQIREARKAFYDKLGKKPSRIRVCESFLEAYQKEVGITSFDGIPLIPDLGTKCDHILLEE